MEIQVQRRNYSDEDKAVALALLKAQKGNVQLVAKQLGMPDRTLYHWADGHGVHPDVAKLGEDKRGELADRIQDLVDLMIGASRVLIVELLKHPGALTADEIIAALKNLSIGIGIGTEKVALLTNDSALPAPPASTGPTVNIQNNFGSRPWD